MRWSCPAILFATFGLSFSSSASQADEKSELVANQKKLVEERLKKLDLEKPVVIETDDLLVAGSLSEDKLKSFSVLAQKYYAYSYKALKFEMGETGPKGKLAVYVFTSRPKYTAYFRIMERTVEKEERSHSEPRDDNPYVAVTLPPGETKGNLETEAGGRIAVALLACKGGPANLPRWMQQGFSKAIQMRVETTLHDKERLAMKRLVGVNPKKTVPMKDPKDTKAATLKDCWGEDDTPERILLSTSLMDYFVFGPDNAKFPRLLAGFRVSDETPNPTIDTAMKAAEFTPEATEKAWKKWISTGK